MTKIWVDDERPAPDGSWLVAKNGDFGIFLIGIHRRNLEEVSLDHDLGKKATGYDVLSVMAREGWWPQELTIHTANPVARKRMLAAANAEAPDWVTISVIRDHLKKD